MKNQTGPVEKSDLVKNPKFHNSPSSTVPPSLFILTPKTPQPSHSQAAQPCCCRRLSYRRASTTSSSDLSSHAVPWCCRLFRLRPCCSAAARYVVRFVCACHRSTPGLRLSSLRRASSKPLSPVSVSDAETSFGSPILAKLTAPLW
ncbi:hypothetical protein PIB30_070319 [Stylosanthes scabra]|uniref:Uncharacterized protein n=1 Tax=Stylosanthes scabra TaxID=79078 RepID=A0ABU6XLN7_9FABA|nr:hypothetical protein [Stylosanthes scabra]